MQWELAEALFSDIFPVIGVLIQEAAQASLIGLDDTHGRILTLMAENILLPMGARHGIHSTGFVTVGEQVIILFLTSCAHAGENLDKLLDLRNPGQKKPTQMGDASRNNTPKRHAGETDCELGLTPEARRDYAEHSGPLLSDLKAWIEAQFRDHHQEPNSALGLAMNYMLKRWERFLQFLTIPGVPPDNNVVERVLKRLIFQRKNSLFFANERSAYIGCALTSLIMTAVEAGVNVFEYLNVLQENRFQVARQPERWLPWNYQQAFPCRSAA